MASSRARILFSTLDSSNQIIHLHLFMLCIFKQSKKKTHFVVLRTCVQCFGSNKLVPEPGSSMFRKNMSLMRDRGVSSVPSRTADELERHALWYCSFLEKGEKKKLIIEKWKKLRSDREAAQLTEFDEVTSHTIGPCVSSYTSLMKR
jgi:hypothetical protein